MLSLRATSTTHRVNPRCARAVLEAAGYPEYFEALLGNRTIVAPDAATDPRTESNSRPYFNERQRGLAPRRGHLARGARDRGASAPRPWAERRDWTTDEQLFAGSIADLAAAVLNHENLERARAALEESQELFSRALRSSPDWISVVRMSDGVILEVNEAFERESGYPSAEVLGRSTLDIGLWVITTQRRRLDRAAEARRARARFRGAVPQEVRRGPHVRARRATR